MSNYTKTTNFTAKDALSSGDPDKIILGSEHDTEYDAIAVAIATKADSASPTLTGTVTVSGDANIKDTATIYDPTDTTKKVRIDVGNVTTGTTRVITVPDRDLTLGPTLGTPIATTSGTSHDFTSIPSWVRRITVMLDNVSTNGTDIIVVQLGDSGGIETSGYNGSAFASGSVNPLGNGFWFASPIAAGAFSGVMTIVRVTSDGLTWAATAASGTSTSPYSFRVSAGSKTLSAALDRIRLTTNSGADTFDAGQVNIMYE